MPHLLSLPDELLKVIASNLVQRNISALVRTNRRLYLSLTDYLYQVNKKYCWGSALAWGARHGVMKTVQYCIQQGFDLEVKCHISGARPLYMAIHNAYYEMVKLLIENGSRIRKRDIYCASRESCHMIIRDNLPKDYGNPTPETGPDHPRSKAFRAAIELGHDELAELKAVRSCNAKISIIRLLLDEVEKTENVRDTKKIRDYSPSSCSLFSNYDEYECCDVSLRLFWEREKKFTSYTRSIDQSAVYTAAFSGNNPLLKVLIEMNAGINYIDWYNRTPIMWAARAGRLETIKFLIEKGADPNLSRDPNVTTLSSAREFGLPCVGLKGPLWYQDEKEKRKTVAYLKAYLKEKNKMPRGSLMRLWK